MNAKEYPVPVISIILPVYNGASYIERALHAIRANTFSDYELIIIDDHSTDSTPELVQKFEPSVYIRTESNRGPYFCRNLGAKHARGKILFFTDVDVVLQHDTLQKVWVHLGEQEKGCVIGLYSLTHPNKNLVSIYKNSWIRFSYLQAPDQVRWFFTAVGAIRKDLWDTNKEFNAQYCNKKGGGDIELGIRLVKNGTTIFLDKQMEVVHLKKFTLHSLLKNDFYRAFGYLTLAFDINNDVTALVNHGFSNIYPTFIVSTSIAGVIVLSLITGFFYYQAFGISAAAFLVMLLINRPFLNYIKIHFSFFTCIAVIPLMLLDYCVCGFGVLTGIIHWIFTQRHTHN